ncbi:MAG: folate-binding protein YgfZ [Acidobacteria bacterium]|nr:folate-binding protein YgfZ [Acidobacteriota bacterium]
MTTAATSNPPQEAISTSQPQLAALLHGAAVATLDQTGWLRVTGSDRVRWLNGMVTNSVQDLAPGQGAYNFFLNAQGRIQGDGYIFASPDALLIETACQQVATLIPYLDHYIIMDDVELADASDIRHGISLIGPEATALLTKLGLDTSQLAELESASLPWNSTTVTVIHAFSALVPRFELWVDTSADAEALLDAVKNSGAVLTGAASLEALRIIEGTPLYGTDVRDRDLPQETNQTRALHFAKGCYLGQEIVERIRSRGNVHRTFTAFRLEGSVPASGTALESAGKAAGELTSIVSLTDDQNQPVTLALGYARREALDRNEPLSYSGGIAHPVSIPAAAEIKLSR